MRVGIATRDWSPTVNPDGTHSLGGSGHYRCGLVAKALTTLGHDVVLGTLTSRRRELGVMTWDGVNHGEFDVMLLQRWMFVDLPPVIEAARARGQAVLNDVDDWWEGLDTGNAAWASSHARSSPIENRDHYRRVLGASSAIVCSTPFLASWYARLAPTITVPNCLDLDRWSPQPVRDGPPVLGWVGALPWRSKGDIDVLTGFLAGFLERHDLRFRHAGAMYPGWEFALEARIPPERLDQSPMVPIEEHEGQFAGMDIAVVPLADKPFNHAKSNLKGLQAAAAGVPFVASDMPEYQRLRNERQVGRTVRNPQQWVKHLTALLDPAVRTMDSLINRGGVQGYGLDMLARRWEIVLDAVTRPAVVHR